MLYTFEYGDTKFASEDFNEVEKYVDQWLSDNFEEFNHYVANRNSSLLEENIEEYTVAFYEDYVEEVT